MAGWTAVLFFLWSAERVGKCSDCDLQVSEGPSSWTWTRVKVNLAKQRNDLLLSIGGLLCLLANIFQGVINSWKMLLCLSKEQWRVKEQLYENNELSVNFDLLPS